MPDIPTAIIVNPAANKGGAHRRWPAIQAELAARMGSIEPQFTASPGHATELARRAVASGARRLVAVGGDGTVNEVLNGMLRGDGRLIAPDSVLCPIPAGTANELARALGHLDDPAKSFDAAASPHRRRIDLLRVSCAGFDGRPVLRFGYLIVSLGAAATISHRTSRSAWLKRLGQIAYFLMTPVVTLAYRQRAIAISIDGGAPATRLLFTALVANTENGGGGMRLMPGAKFDDGMLELIEIGDVTRLGVLFGIMPKLYSGAHVHHPKVKVSRGTSFHFSSAHLELLPCGAGLETPPETLVDLDGETVGRLPLDVAVLPRAFSVGVAGLDEVSDGSGASR